MRKPEQVLWDDVSGLMKPVWYATRIENEATSGLPDVEWSGAKRSGWLELKVVERARMGEPLVISHLRAEQANWFDTKAKRGDGRADLLVRINTIVVQPRSRLIEGHFLIPAWLVADVYDRKYLLGSKPASAAGQLGELSRDWLWQQLRMGDRYAGE